MSETITLKKSPLDQFIAERFEEYKTVCGQVLSHLTDEGAPATIQALCDREGLPQPGDLGTFFYRCRSWLEICEVLGGMERATGYMSRYLEALEYEAEYGEEVGNDEG